MFTRLFVNGAQLTKSSRLQPLKNTSKPSANDFCTRSKKEEQPVTVANIKKTLKAYEHGFEEGLLFFKTTCPLCDRKKKDPIYINKTTGHFICASCQHIDKWSTIQKCFTSYTSPTAQKEIDDLRQSYMLYNKPAPSASVVIPEEWTTIKKCSDSEIQEFLDDSGIAHITVEAVKSTESYFDQNKKCLNFPLRDVNGRIVGFKSLSKNQNDSLEETTTPDSNSFGLIVLKPYRNTSVRKQIHSAVLVLNVLDMLALNTQDINACIVVLPHSFKSLPQQSLPILEKFRKFFLWFNSETQLPHWNTAKYFAKKLDEKRCFFVRSAGAHTSPYEALQNGININNLLLNTHPILHKAITTFATLRQDVLNDLQNNDKVQGVKWNRFPILNKLMKGHRKGELTVLTGPTGCGKTTFISDYSLDLAMQGVTTLWGSFEIQNTRLAATLLRQMVGSSLHDNLDSFDRWADDFQKLPIYFLTFHGQQSIKIVMETIDHAQYVHDVHHVIIDNVQFMLGTSEMPSNDRFWKQDSVVAAFRQFATTKNCHVTLVIHPRKEREAEDLTTNSIFGSAKASQEADNVLIIQDKRLTSIRGKKYLQVAKNRFSGDLGIMPLDFDKESLRYGQKRGGTDDAKKTNHSAEKNKISH